MSTEGDRLKRLREAVENASPEHAAAAAARRFERDAIPVPPVLHAPPSASALELRAHRDAGELYRSLVIAGPDSLTVTQLWASAYIVEARFDVAMWLLRASGLVVEHRPDGLLEDVVQLARDA